MTKIYTIEGGGGLGIHVREWGTEKAPTIIFIHGWSQSHLCWSKQYTSDLLKNFRLIALDLRGHGMSAAPIEVEHYNHSQLWAEDIAAIIEQLDVVKPVLSGWSYGSLVIADYVRIFGTEKLGAINFVGGPPALNEHVLGKLIGPGFYENFEACTNPDHAISLPAIAKFLHDCFEIEPRSEDFEIMLASNAVVSPLIRANLAARDIDNTDILSDIDVPVLVSHGRKDRVVLPSAAEVFLQHCPNAQAAWYDDVGHVPFVENAVRFNQDIAALAEQVTG